jgi:hypothetical protein
VPTTIYLSKSVRRRDLPCSFADVISISNGVINISRLFADNLVHDPFRHSIFTGITRNKLVYELAVILFIKSP